MVRTSKAHHRRPRIYTLKERPSKTPSVKGKTRSTAPTSSQTQPQGNSILSTAFFGIYSSLVFVFVLAQTLSAPARNFLANLWPLKHTAIEQAVIGLPRGIMRRIFYIFFASSGQSPGNTRIDPDCASAPLDEADSSIDSSDWPYTDVLLTTFSASASSPAKSTRSSSTSASSTTTARTAHEWPERDWDGDWVREGQDELERDQDLKLRGTYSQPSGGEDDVATTTTTTPSPALDDASEDTQSDADIDDSNWHTVFDSILSRAPTPSNSPDELFTIAHPLLVGLGIDNALSDSDSGSDSDVESTGHHSSTAAWSQASSTDDLHQQHKGEEPRPRLRRYSTYLHERRPQCSSLECECDSVRRRLCPLSEEEEGEDDDDGDDDGQSVASSLTLRPSGETAPAETAPAHASSSSGSEGNDAQAASSAAADDRLSLPRSWSQRSKIALLALTSRPSQELEPVNVETEADKVASQSHRFKRLHRSAAIRRMIRVVPSSSPSALAASSSLSTST
ncbi:hypothetical protein V8E36_004868 [Tilletia maclaganii]